MTGWLLTYVSLEDSSMAILVTEDRAMNIDYWYVQLKRRVVTLLASDAVVQLTVFVVMSFLGLLAINAFLK